MPAAATFATFQAELGRLVEVFGRNLSHYKSSGYDEASLRIEFLNPFFRALGWDVENLAGHIPRHREVEIESRTQIGGRQKRADFLFRTDTRDRFVCEAKKPAEELHSRAAFQAKRYGWNKDLPFAILTDFEEIKLYVVGGKPRADEPQMGEWKTWHYLQFPLVAQEIWDLLSREKVAVGSIDQLLDSLPKSKPTGKGKARQQWLIKPDRSRALDTDFLEFLDEARRELASDLYKHNDHTELLQDNKLNEAVQRILDRILFIRICEDRDIDTGRLLHSIVETWRKQTGSEAGVRSRQISFAPALLREEPPANYGGQGLRAPMDSLWHVMVCHFRALDRRPPSHTPFFNGNLFKPHFSESLIVGDEWLAEFIGDLSDDETPYLFNVIPVEILGSVYERFLGKVVRPQGRGITVEEKPEVRKAGGVYYTPRYIVDYIVEQTVGKLADEIAGAPSIARPGSTTPSQAEQCSALVRLRGRGDRAVEVGSCAVLNRAVSNRNCVGAIRGGEQRNENDPSVTQACRVASRRELDSVGVDGRVCERKTKPVERAIGAEPNRRTAGWSPDDTLMVGEGMVGSPSAVIRETRQGQAELKAPRPEAPPGGSQSVRSSQEAGNDRGAKGRRKVDAR